MALKTLRNDLKTLKNVLKKHLETALNKPSKLALKNEFLKFREIGIYREESTEQKKLEIFADFS